LLDDHPSQEMHPSVNQSQGEYEM
jgi:hypothetical protein